MSDLTPHRADQSSNAVNQKPDRVGTIRFEGKCSRCKRLIRIALPAKEAGKSPTIHVRCRSCNKVNWVERAPGETRR